MNVNEKQGDTDQQDLNDFFLAMRQRDPIFLMAIGLTTRSNALRKRISEEVSAVTEGSEKENCNAEVIPLSY